MFTEIMKRKEKRKKKEEQPTKEEDGTDTGGPCGAGTPA